MLGVTAWQQFLNKKFGSSPAAARKLSKYAASTNDELDATRRLIAALYANMQNFEGLRASSILLCSGKLLGDGVEAGNCLTSRTGILCKRSPRSDRRRAILERARGRRNSAGQEPLIEDVQRVLNNSM